MSEPILLWQSWAGQDRFGCTCYAGSTTMAARGIAVQIAHLVSVLRHEAGFAPDDAMDEAWKMVREQYGREVCGGALASYRRGP